MVHDELPLIEFNSFDRCDRCGAQAYTAARRDDVNSELLFCLHHRRENIAHLIEDGWEIIDGTQALELLAEAEGIKVS